MQRRELIAMSVGGLVAAAFHRMAVGKEVSAPVSRSASGSPPSVSSISSAPSAREDEAAARRYDKERRFADTRFGRIAYIDRGAGPVVLFLHGFPLSSFQWRGAIERLSGERRCVAPDWMGLGYTEVAAGQSVAPEAQCQMLAVFLDSLGIQQVDLVANDSGGAVAQLFVTKFPQRVRTLLLTNCDVEVDSPPAALLPVIDLARAGIYPDLWLEPWFRHKEVARSATGLGGMCYSDPRHPTDAALDQYLRPVVASAERKALVNRYALGLERNPLQGIAPLLKKCTVPTRIVWGTEDRIFSPASPDYLSGLMPRVTGIRRVGAKLFFPEEYPDIIPEEARLLWQQRT